MDVIIDLGGDFLVVLAHLGVLELLLVAEGTLRQRLRVRSEGEAGLGVVLRLSIPVRNIDGDDLPGANLSEEDLLRELILDLALDGTA